MWLSILRHLPRPSVTSVRFLEANIPNQGYREEESIKELMRIKPLYTFNDTDFDSGRLKSLGIKTVRGPRHMTEELVQALSPYLKEK